MGNVPPFPMAAETDPPHPQTPLPRLVRELLPYRRWLGLGTLCLLLAGPASIVPTLMWMVVVDHVLLGQRISWLLPSLRVAVLFYAVSVFFGAWRDRLYERAGQEFIRDLRGRLYGKLLSQSPGYLHNQRSGDVQARVISDVDAVQSSIIAGFSSMAQEAYSFALVLGAIVWINPVIGGTVFVPLFICFFVVRHFNERMKRAYSEVREALGDVGARLQETLAGFPVIKAFQRAREEEAAFAAATTVHFERSMGAVRLRTRVFPIVFSIAFSTNVIMLGLGAWLVYRGQFTLGGLVALRGFWWQLNSPVRTLAQVNDLLQRAIASANRIYRILDAPVLVVDHPDAHTLSHARLPLRFDQLSFAYHPGKPVLTGLDLTIEPGETVALAGASGAGKSTLLALLARFYDPSSGCLWVGDHPLTRITQESWRKRIGFVLQETYLFNTTILENIRYGRPEASIEMVVAAARQANADRFIEDLPHGYETVVGERGVKLSGGQRQRIGVARAFLSNPDVLLMDEPTSSVEPESESIIQDSLIALMPGRTVFLSSHRPSLLRRAHRVVFLEHGRIREMGPHEQLLSQGGPYARMIALWETEESMEREFGTTQR